MKELSVIYYSERLKKKYSKKIISSIQDIFVATGNSVQFIEVEDSSRSRVRKYIETECSDSIVIIIGGEEVFPFEKIKSQVDDGDDFVNTYNWWASF
jgi:hypothetical protein